MRINFINLNYFYFLFFFILAVVVININDKYERRFVNEFINIYIKNPIESISKSEHGGHYLTALKIFENNKTFGVGFKNYGKEIKKKNIKIFLFSINKSLYTSSSNTF